VHGVVVMSETTVCFVVSFVGVSKKNGIPEVHLCFFTYVLCFVEEVSATNKTHVDVSSQCEV